MTEVSMEKVVAVADEFFARHWPASDCEVPVWSQSWNLVGTLPGHDMQGIYLLLGEDDRVLYIGVGASLGGGNYVGHGLGARTSRYVRMAEGQRSVPAESRKYIPSGVWADRGLSRIATLGFSQGYAYLAYGLEAYLLREIETPYNKVRSARVASF